MTDRREKASPLRADVTLVSGSEANARKRAAVAPSPEPASPEPASPEPGPALHEPRSPEPPSHESPPLRLRDEGEIGEGGMGSVRKVFDTVLLRHVAMKIMAPEMKDDSEARERFVQEAQITAQLEHPNIVPLYDAGQTDRVGDYVLLKLVRGRTLREELAELQRHRTASEEDLLRLVQILLKVCDAIAFAHSRGVVHRDLKPSNVMIGEYGQVYVVDWGVAVVAEPALHADTPSVRISAKCTTSPPVGTRGYMAPEQALARGAGGDKRSDVYALGAILYEMLSGKAPPSREQPNSGLLSADQRVPFPSSSSIWPRLPAALAQMAMKALEPNPDDRYASVEELQGDLDEFVAAGDWFDTRTFAAGETIVEEGAQGDAAYIIVAGRCEVKKLVGKQQEIIRSLGPGDVFGETAIFFPQPRTASVAAVDKVIVKIVTKKALEFELRRSPWFGAFVRALAARFSELDRRLSEGLPSEK